MQSLAAPECPQTYSPQLCALWFDFNNDWNKAHHIIQNLQDKKSARIHAYLHRKEGDNSNSRYWHRIAETQFPEGISLQEEWESLVKDNCLAVS